ncbi:MAG: RsmE family RNA methyltransferase, partial [Planctomycetota bacterium]
MHRFFATSIPPQGGIVNLDADQSRHATQVLRCREGDLVELFDGAGNVAQAEVITAARRAPLSLQSTASRHHPNLPSIRLTIAAAIPKGDRSRFLIEKLTELGVAAVLPVQCEFSQWKTSNSVIEKLR